MKNLLVALVLTAAAIAQTPAPQAQPAQPATTRCTATCCSATRRSHPPPNPLHRRSRRKRSRTPPNTTPTWALSSNRILPPRSADWKHSSRNIQNSVMKEDALDLLMATYQQANNQAKVVETANKILAANPDNVKALVLLAYYDRAGQKWADAKQHAERGLQALPKWTKPEGVSDADFEKQKTQFSGIAQQRCRVCRPFS